jgi:hypothetical protein
MDGVPDIKQDEITIDENGAQAAGAAIVFSSLFPQTPTSCWAKALLAS